MAKAGRAISDFVIAKEELQRKGQKKKKTGVRSSDLEEFMALEAIKQKEKELQQFMIYCGRPGLHSDWVKYQVEARKRRQKAEADRLRKIADLKENALLAVAWLGGILVLGFITIMIVWGLVKKGVL